MRFALLVVAVLGAPCVWAQEPAACAPVAPIPLVNPAVLGDGTPDSVTTAQIQAALDAGGHVRFDLGPAPATIDVTSELIVTRAAVLDGGGTVTLSGRGLNRVLRVRGALSAAQAYLFGLQNITIADGATPTEDGGGQRAGRRRGRRSSRPAPPATPARRPGRPRPTSAASCARALPTSARTRSAAT